MTAARSYDEWTRLPRDMKMSEGVHIYKAVSTTTRVFKCVLCVRFLSVEVFAIRECSSESVLVQFQG
jgi:hypothetical protein